jgi:hypothetical protein
MPVMLTKSNYLGYRQCPKRLWLEKHRKELMPPVPPDTQKMFGEGHAVEAFALQLFPGYVDASDPGFREAINKTQRLVSEAAAVIYQPTFSVSRLFCRSDVIVRQGEAWDLYEIKSSTQVKDEHLLDLAFQYQVLNLAGLKVGRVFVIHINREYVRAGEIDPEQLLTTVEVSQEVGELVAEVNGEIPDALAVADQREEPEVLILNQCRRPYECPFIDYCWQDMPELSVYQLGLNDQKLLPFVQAGQIAISDVPESAVTVERKQPFYRAAVTGKTQINQEAIQAWLDQLEYPLHYLDYETFATAMPLFDGYSPYQQMVFQQSVHVQAAPDAPLEHFEYLHQDLTDPAAAVVDSLKQAIGPQGSVLVWYRTFESGRNEELARHCPESADFLHSLNARMLDLMDPFWRGDYADPKFGGRASIKKVLPVLVPELSYDDLEIGHGGLATVEWRRMVDSATDPAEAAKIAKQLLIYCGQDTLAMVRILEVLQRAVA